MEVKFGETHRWPCMYSISIPEEEKVMYLTEPEVKDLMKQKERDGDSK